MELYVFDRGLNFVGLMDTFFSLRWVRRYHRAGEFELHCGLTPATLSLLRIGNVVWKNDDQEAGIIEYRNISLNAQKEEVLVAKGRFATSLLGRRIIWGTEIINNTVEIAIRTLVNNHAVNPTNPDRAIPKLQLGNIKGFTQLVDMQVSYANLLEEIEALTQTHELGIRTLFNPTVKTFTFDLYEGLDRTITQTANAPAIFAQEYENVLEQEYSESINNYRNIALVGGIGEGVERELITVGSGMGQDRFEVFVDQRNLSNETDDGTPIPQEEYQAMLAQKGLEVLAESKEIQTFDSKINIGANLIYKQDFDLGDLVTCLNRRWGITIDTRITEIEEVYETNGKSINVTFGNSVPTLIDKIKQVVS